MLRKHYYRSTHSPCFTPPKELDSVASVGDVVFNYAQWKKVASFTCMTCLTRREVSVDVLQETELLDVATGFAHRDSKHRPASASHLGRPQTAAADF